MKRPLKNKRIKYNRYIFLLFFLMVYLHEITSQENSGKVILANLPQYVLIKGHRTDIEIQVSNKTWLVVGPQFFLDHRYDENEFITETSYGNDYNRMAGAGLDLHLKFKQHNDLIPFTIYYALGPTFRYFAIKKYSYNWIDSEYQDLPVITYQPDNFTENHYQFSMNTIIGVQKVMNRFVVDAYIGGALRYSFSDNKNVRTSSDNVMDYSYTGALPVAGIKLGIFL